MVKLEEVSIEPGSSPSSLAHTHASWYTFSNKTVDPMCLHCQPKDEDIHHAVCPCPAFYEYHVSSLSQFRQAVIEATDPETWDAYFTHWGNIT